jgi:DNA gyrase subunit A
MEDVAKEITYAPLEEEIVSSFLPYALAVVEDRAIPDSRDGLKPVQRRIIYGMYEMGLTPNSPFKKSARVVGDVMGKYHPHGDMSIYDALVRMTNQELTNLPLTSGHGNFGRIDPELRAAASRYTEVKLSQAALYLTEEIKEATVALVPNFDSEETEPAVLPAAYPNLLVNGASGVAVGIATSIPSHNLQEICDYCIAVSNGVPDEGLPLLYPDFSTGGVLIDDEMAHEAIKNGRGAIRLRGRYKVETKGRKKFIIFTELPYGVYPRKIIEQIASAKARGSLAQVIDAKDYTDKNGISVVIEVSPAVNVNALCMDLYKSCDLETKIQFNFWALEEGRPKQFSTEELAKTFISFRLGVLKARSQFRLEQIEKRLHLVEGILKAYSILDQVIATIKTSPAPAAGLMKLGFTSLQAEYILNLQLRRLANIEMDKYEKEKTTLERDRDQLRRLLESEQELKKLFRKEMIEISRKLGVARKTLIEKDSLPAVSDSKPAVMLEDQDVVLSFKLNVANQSVTRSKTVSSVSFSSTLYSRIGVVTASGNYSEITAVEVPERSSRISELFEISSRDRVIGAISVSSFDYLLVWTKKGFVKKISVDELKSGTLVAAFKDKDDEIISCFGAKEGDEYGVAISQKGQLLRYKLSDISPKGKQALAILGMGLRAEDQIIGAYLASEGDICVTLTDAKNIKVTAIDEFPITARGSIGTRIQRFLSKEAQIQASLVGKREILKAITADNKAIAITEEATPRGNSSSFAELIGLGIYVR